VPAPEPVSREGRYARLAPIDPEKHSEALFAASTAPGAGERFRYLFDHVPADAIEMAAWSRKAASTKDPLFWTVIDRATGRAEGRQALMRIEPVHGVIEIGSILWGPAIARTRVATEAFFLAASYVFDTLGYRRLEWKCDDRNEPSKRAALRFGFAPEGVFRQHMVVKGESRDTAWFAIIDADWPLIRAGIEAWLAPDNFDAAGRERSKLDVRRRA
jgi:RimJ/RimL family protein N-acetyltransferase